MLTKLRLKRFKMFGKDITFDLADRIILAGPNNCGKTTILQALALWARLIELWRLEKGTLKTRIRRVTTTRDRLTALPVRDSRFLWTDAAVAFTEKELPSGKKLGTKKDLLISVEGETAGQRWTVGFDLVYGTKDTLYFKPTDDISEQAIGINIVHVPAMAGLAYEEPRYDKGYQDQLIGMGKSGDILRNLLYEIYSTNKDEWKELVAFIEELFSCKLKPPKYKEGDPYIIIEYKEASRRKNLDLANAGSGFLQVLLILSFFYARKASILLLDEPDAHLHFILERQVYDLIKEIGYKNDCQLIIATHSALIIDETDAEEIMALLPTGARRLVSSDERRRLIRVLRNLKNTEILLAAEEGKILYLEDKSDLRLLRTWAEILEHPSYGYLTRPNVNFLHTNAISKARSNFSDLSFIFESLNGLCLLDNDSDLSKNDDFTANPPVVYWRRREIENYLLLPEVLIRYTKEPLLIEGIFAKELPKDFDVFGDSFFLAHKKASDFLESKLREIGIPLKKRDLYRIAEIMEPDEIHPDVKAKLDVIYDTLSNSK